MSDLHHEKHLEAYVVIYGLYSVVNVYRTVISGIFLWLVCALLKSSVREWCRHEYPLYVCVYVL